MSDTTQQWLQTGWSCEQGDDGAAWERATLAHDKCIEAMVVESLSLPEAEKICAKCGRRVGAVCHVCVFAAQMAAAMEPRVEAGVCNIL